MATPVVSWSKMATPVMQVYSWQPVRGSLARYVLCTWLLSALVFAVLCLCYYPQIFIWPQVKKKKFLIDFTLLFCYVFMQNTMPHHVFWILWNHHGQKLEGKLCMTTYPAFEICLGQYTWGFQAWITSFRSLLFLFFPLFLKLKIELRFTQGHTLLYLKFSDTA